MRVFAEPSSSRIKLWPLNESTGIRYSGPEVRWSELSGKPIPTYYVTHWGPTPSLRNPFGWKRLSEHYGRARRGTEDAEYRGLPFGRVINWGLYQGVVVQDIRYCPYFSSTSVAGYGGLLGSVRCSVGLGRAFWGQDSVGWAHHRWEVA